jgi:hypothetical protein
MRPERRGELHRHGALVTAESAPPRAAASAHHSGSLGVSLLRLSVPARLLIVAVAAALLWGAVLWALQ